MGNIKSKGAVVICAVAIVLIIVLLVMGGGKKEPVQPNAGNATTNQTDVNTPKDEFAVTNPDGSKENTSDKLKQTKTVEGVELTNIRLIENGGLSQLVADAKNTTSSTIDELDIIITAVDKEGNTLTTFEASVYTLGAGKTTKLNASVTEKIANAYDFTVRKK